jgi:general secretion pathway protein D
LQDEEHSPAISLGGVGLRTSKRIVLVLLALALVLPASADESAKSLYKKGRDAEARQNYEAAYEAYKAAYEKKPTDLLYRSGYERMRFQAAALHVHRGQQLRQNGDLQRALAEFQKAAQIDPSSFIAQQEIVRTQKMISDAVNPQGAGNAPP